MKLDEAIVGLEDLLTDDPHFDPERRREAVQLGIKALKRIKGNRLYPQPTVYPLLPGETKE